MRARSRFGIAIAAMIKMIATTISNSINEKPELARACALEPIVPTSKKSNRQYAQPQGDIFGLIASLSLLMPAKLCAEIMVTTITITVRLQDTRANYGTCAN